MLADVSHTDHGSDLEEDLLRLATLGETFTEQRQRTKISAELADTLDREGCSRVYPLSAICSRSPASQVCISGISPVSSAKDQKVAMIASSMRFVSSCGVAGVPLPAVL